MHEDIILTFISDTIDLTVFDKGDKVSDGWTVNLTKGEAAILAAKLLQYAASED